MPQVPLLASSQNKRSKLKAVSRKKRIPFNMVLMSIPLVGMMDLDEQQIAMVGMVAEFALNKPLKVSEDVWIELIRRKYAGRYRNIDDPLREVLGLPIENKPVKRYSDESEENGAIQA